jgi:SAM-dependent methyltransferase
MNINCIVFGASKLREKEVTGMRVMEVGSCDINGSLRPIVESWKPAEYVGVDIEKGPGVDVVCRAEDLDGYFPKDSFDIVISTEMIEHIEDWRKAVSSIKAVCKPQGIILITTRSIGFRYHGFPHDFWRYTSEDMEEIFSDCDILALEKDTDTKGVFIKARKKEDFVERDLSTHMLYSIVANKRVKEISKADFFRPRFRYWYAIDQISKFMEQRLPRFY